MTETLPRDVEISAARQDAESTTRLLVHAANAMKDTAGIPRSAHVAYAQAILTYRAEDGNARASRKLREYVKAATAYEGARVALADLTREEVPMTDTVRRCGGCNGVLEDWQPDMCSYQCGMAVKTTRDIDED